MASKFVVFVVFAVVARAQASLSAADVASARKTTHDSWYQAIDSLYKTMANQSVSLSDGQSQYVAPAVVGRKAFLSVAPQGKNQTLLDQLSALGKKELGLIFGAMATAKSATSANYSACITEINNSRKQMPLPEGVKLDYQFAGSSAQPTGALSVLDQAFDLYYTGMKALAAYKAGKSTKVDISSETPAQKALSKYIDYIYNLLSCYE